MTDTNGRGVQGRGGPGTPAAGPVPAAEGAVRLGEEGSPRNPALEPPLAGAWAEGGGVGLLWCPRFLGRTDRA